MRVFADKDERITYATKKKENKVCSEERKMKNMK